jgi:hypothetical protein
MAIKHIILLFVETPNFFLLKARRRTGRVVDRKLPNIGPPDEGPSLETSKLCLYFQVVVFLSSIVYANRPLAMAWGATP